MKFEMTNLDTLMADLEGFGDMTEVMIYDMLIDSGDVVVEAQKRTARTMLKGPMTEEDGVEKSIQRGKVSNINGGMTLNIVFKGTQHGNRLAEIAFVNEFGKTNQPARPFIATANEESADEAQAAAEKALDYYLKKNRL